MHYTFILPVRPWKAPDAVPIGQAVLLGAVLLLLGWLVSALAGSDLPRIMPGAHDGPEPVVQLIDPPPMTVRASAPPPPAGS